GWGSYAYTLRNIQGRAAECHKGPPELSSWEQPLCLAAGFRGASILRQSLDVNEELERSCLLNAHQEPQVDRCTRRQRRSKRDCASRKRRVVTPTIWLPTPCNFDRRALHRHRAWCHARGAR